GWVKNRWSYGAPSIVRVLTTRPEVTPVRNALFGASLRKSASGRSMPARPTASFSIPSIVAPSGTGSLAYFLIFRRVDSKRLPVEDEFVRPIVSSHVGEQPVRPVHRVEDVKRLTVRLRVHPDRARLKRQLLGAQGLAHPKEC